MQEVRKRAVELVQNREEALDTRLEAEEEKVRMERRRQREIEEAERGNRHMFDMIKKERDLTEEELEAIYEYNPKIKHAFEMLLTTNLVIKQDETLKKDGVKNLYEKNRIIAPLSKLLRMY